LNFIYRNTESVINCIYCGMISTNLDEMMAKCCVICLHIHIVVIIVSTAKNIYNDLNIDDDIL